jgi:4a-hydroxytetrahydrobiopterin dehydratase
METNQERSIPGWNRDGSSLVRTDVFPDFGAAMVWVNRVAAFAGRRNHHPDIEIRWNRVTLRLTTHEAGGLTEQDWNWAEVANDVLQTRECMANGGK